ncbi:response regulator transcription factor [Streptomyces sp. NPDC014746]|uniref:response regulator transcription factor n=1 Tax=Streptomyces sp. NPDC014746 TaxID=3364904 RepID=UPI003702DC94
MRVLIVEDEEDLAVMLADGLRGGGMTCDAVRAQEMTAAAAYDVSVLDRDLPQLSGDAVCRARNTAGHPARILMLTAAGALTDLVDGLGHGADDYMSRPFSSLEQVARLRTPGRRSGIGATATVLSRHGVERDTVRCVAERDGRPLKLTLGDRDPRGARRGRVHRRRPGPDRGPPPPHHPHLPRPPRRHRTLQELSGGR